MKKLTKLRRKSNVGCRYGNQYMGVYCYADDVSLLSSICETFTMEQNIIVNAKKSPLLC